MVDPQSHSLSLREIRNVPETINATFEFLRLHRRKLGRLLLFRVYPILFVSNALSLVHPTSQSGGGNILITIVQILAFLITFSIMIAVVHALAKLTDRDPSGAFDDRDVWNEAKELLGNVVGTNVGLAFILAFLFFFSLYLFRIVLFGLPLLTVIAMISLVMWFGVNWSLYYPTRLLENGGFTESFGASRYLVRGHWWRTLGLMITWGLLGYALTALLVLPPMLSEIGLDLVTPLSFRWLRSGVFGLIIFHLLAFISNVLSVTVQSLPMAGMVLHFYSQLERREGGNLHELADTIGASADRRRSSPTGVAMGSGHWETAGRDIRGESEPWGNPANSGFTESEERERYTERDSRNLGNE